MNPLPKPSLPEAIATLRDRDEYKVILNFIRDERERSFADLRQCESTNDVMKIVGTVAALDELLQILS